MGLTCWEGENIRKLDVEIAKNYLNAEELDVLNRIVSMYLDFAELQALNNKPMYMKDWITKLDNFMRISERNILNHAGKVSHKAALDKARSEYDKYRCQLVELPSQVEKDFFEAVKKVKQIDVINKQNE